MKFLPRLLAGLLFALAATARAADPVAQLLTEAQTSYLRGDLDAAKAKLQAVKTLDPKNPTAAAYLRKIQVQEAERGGSSDRSLARLIVPSVQFREAELSAVLEALRQQAAKLTNGQQAVNFVVQLPADQARTPITLSLANVPFTEVLKYIGTLANVTFVFDKYAIMVRPSTGAKTEPSPAEAVPPIKGL